MMGTPCTDAGSIGDLFTSLGTAPPLLGEQYADLKGKVCPNKEDLDASWARLQKAVEKEVSIIQKEGSSVIPCVNFCEIARNNGRFPEDVASQIQKRGCAVVRNTVDPDHALEMKAKTKEYIQKNRMLLSGFPKDSPQVWEVYWSRPQLAMRQHPNVLATQRALNRLWHCSAVPGTDGQFDVDVHRPLTYCDRLRIRNAGDTSFTLGPHVDGGSTERWEDDDYRKVYAKILAGNWEQYDAFDATYRASAKYEMYGRNLGACSIFRSFQGWVSLSNSGTGRGALQLVPLLREATAFLILRPFLEDVPATSFCGANPGKVQDLFPEFHQRLIDALVAVPDVQPGDSVWWHCDLIHAVEGSHCGKEDSSVFYIPAVRRKRTLRLRTRCESTVRPSCLTKSVNELNDIDFR